MTGAGGFDHGEEVNRTGLAWRALSL